MGFRVRIALAAVGAFVLGVILGPWVFDQPTPATVESDVVPQAVRTDAASPEPEEVLMAPEPTPTALPTRELVDSDIAKFTQGELVDLLAGVQPGADPAAGTGELRLVLGQDVAPEADAPIRTIRFEVEAGLDVDLTQFATFALEVLNDPRGWSADGLARFEWTDGEADIRVILASPTTVDSLCAPLATNGRWSCGMDGFAALNAQRWFQGAQAFSAAGGDLTDYRRYLVNHEVGHVLGLSHNACAGAGEVAPVMMQQSISVGQCLPNGWPHP